MDNIYGKKVNRKLKELFFKDKYTNLKILDLGCGNGANSMFFAQKGSLVKAVDIDKDVLRVFDHKNITKYGMNINLFFRKHAGEKFDVILALNILQFLTLKEIRSVVPKILKSLCKGGMLVLTMFDSPVVDFINRQLDDFKVLDYWHDTQFDQIAHPHMHHIVSWVVVKP